jgi:hypothetical protein
MTKQNPDKLCGECKEFDYLLNRSGGISFDMFVVCEHDEEEVCMKLPDNDAQHLKNLE